MMKERFSKLLLGEDMSGCGKGVSTALAISNAITNLCGMFSTCVAFKFWFGRLALVDVRLCFCEKILLYSSFGWLSFSFFHFLYAICSYPFWTALEVGTFSA